MPQEAILRRKGYLPPREVAKKVGREVTSVYRWLNAGKIRGIRVGRARYVDLRSLETYLGEEGVVLLGLGRP